MSVLNEVAQASEALMRAFGCAPDYALDESLPPLDAQVAYCIKRYQETAGQRDNFRAEIDRLREEIRHQRVAIDVASTDIVMLTERVRELGEENARLRGQTQESDPEPTGPLTEEEVAKLVSGDTLWDGRYNLQFVGVAPVGEEIVVQFETTLDVYRLPCENLTPTGETLKRLRPQQEIVEIPVVAGVINGGGMPIDGTSYKEDGLRIRPWIVGEKWEEFCKVWEIVPGQTLKLRKVEGSDA